MTRINRKDYGITWNVGFETGGVLVGDEVKISLEVEAVEVRGILQSYGLTAEESAPVVHAMRGRRDGWIDFMMRFELGLEKPDPRRALSSALTIAPDRAYRGDRRWSGLRDRSTDFVASAGFRGPSTSGGEGPLMSGSVLIHRNNRRETPRPSGNGQRVEAGAHPRLAGAIVANCSSGIAVLVGPILVCELVNPAFQAFAPGKDMLGRPFAEVWPEISDQVAPKAREVLNTGVSCSITDTPCCFRLSPEAPLETIFSPSATCRYPSSERQPLASPLP